MCLCLCVCVCVCVCVFMWVCSSVYLRVYSGGTNYKHSTAADVQKAFGGKERFEARYGGNSTIPVAEYVLAPLRALIILLRLSGPKHTHTHTHTHPAIGT